MKKFIKTVFVLALLAAIIAPFGLFAYYYTKFHYDFSVLVDYKPQITSKIYDKNGVKIANVFNETHRYYVPFEEIPPRAVEALLAIEDTTFFEHPGVNVEAIFRAAIKVIRAGKAVEGASTITQQLVKNVLLTREKKLSRKIKEAIYAIKIEQVLTKEQILERYFNEIYYGHGYYGLQTAADGYFHKKLADLTLKEIAILVGLPKAPSIYAPTRNYEISMGRANRVVERMHVLGWIDEATYQAALKENPKVYNETLTQNQAPFVVDEVMRKFAELGIDDFKTGGYEVHTTIDMKLQNAAQESLKHAYDLSLKRIEQYKKDEGKHRSTTLLSAHDIDPSKLNGALVSLDSATGNILALVGSVDYAESSFNRATQGKRQPGSAFKPFIYQVAIDFGFSGASQLVDIAKTYEYQSDGESKKWQPKNYEKNYKGILSLREALVHSRNLATINLVNDIGLSQLIRELEKFGIEDIPNNLSISLGTMSMSPLDLAKFYTSFSNNGEQQLHTNLISSIEQNGRVIYESTSETKMTSLPTQSYIMTTILKDVVDRGTGRRAAVKGMEIAGKTGTTNNNIDGWFVGYSPTIITAVWFGNDDNTPMYRRETGATVAGPAFARYYENILKFYPQIQREFVAPEGIIEVQIGGKKEFFSEISKPPREEQMEAAEEELLF